MVYDEHTGQMLMFGGCTAYDVSPVTCYHDLWQWNGTTWKVVPESEYPGARGLAAVAYDPTTEQLLLFGGANGTGDGSSSDTWEWSGTDWTELSDDSGPAPGLGTPSMVYDASTNQLLLIETDYPSDEVWIWTGSSWSQLNPATAGPDGQLAVYDPASSQLIMYGGDSCTDVCNGGNQTWEWTGTNWTRLTPLHSPPISSGVAVGYDGNLHGIVANGGEGGLDTWLWNGSDWEKLSLSTHPPTLYYSSMGWDPATSQFLMFGGIEDTTPTSYTWLLASTPQAASIDAAYSLNGAALVVVTPPPSSGGTPVTKYTVTAKDLTHASNGGQVVTSIDSSITVPNLHNGDTYEFTVTAANVVGSGPPSPYGGSVVPAGVPNAPTIGIVQAATDGAVVTFSPVPVSGDGGSAVQGYTVKANDLTDPADSGDYETSNTPANLTPLLTPGHLYDFQVAAFNNQGLGPFSSASETVVPTSRIPVGTVVIANADAGTVLDFAPGSTTGASIGSDFVRPISVAFDGIGDAFVVDSSTHSVYKVSEASGSQDEVTTGVREPDGLAVDVHGDLFVSAPEDDQVVEVPAGASSGTPIGTGLSGPTGVAVDAAGDVFIADTGHDRLVKELAGGHGQVVVDSDLNEPTGVVVSTAGNVYVANTGANDVVEISSTGHVSKVNAGKLSQPTGVALDARGDLFISDSTSDHVVEVNTSGRSSVLNVEGLSGPSGLDVYAPPPTFTADNPELTLSSGTEYSYRFAAVAPSHAPGATFAVTSGVLPPGMALAPSTGVLSGTPTKPGRYVAAISAENAAHATTHTYSFVVQNCAPRPRSSLEGCDFSHRNLSHVNLSGAHLQGADFADANVEGANLSGSILSNAVFTGASLSSTNFSGAVMAGVRSGAVRGAPKSLPKSWALAAGYLIGPGAALEDAKLTGVSIPHVSLQSAHLTGADVARADFSHATLNGVISGGLVGTPRSLPPGWRLTDGYLAGAGANLVDAALAHANLSGLDLTGANLEGADLVGATVRGADLDAAHLSDVRSGGLVGAVTHLPGGWRVVQGYLVGPDADLQGANLFRAPLSGADLAGANLTGATLVAANLSGANLTGVNLRLAGLMVAVIVHTTLVHANFTDSNLAGAYVKSSGLAHATWGNTVCPDSTNSNTDGGSCVSDL